MYFDGSSSDTIAMDMNSLLHSSTFEHPSNGEFSKIKEVISSDSYSNYNHHEHNQRQTESSLMRYHSAPSSFYANILDESGCDDFLAPVSNQDPDERFFFRNQKQQQQFQSVSHEFIQYGSSSMKLNPKEAENEKLDLPPVSTAMYGGCSNQVPHLLPSNTNAVYNHNNLESSSTFRSMNSTASNLIRQSSSPAGFLTSLNDETGFAGTRDSEKTCSSSKWNNQINFTAGPQITENQNEINDPTFRNLKRSRDGDSVTLDRQNGASMHHIPSLVHHMSLPNTSSEMEIVENYMRFEQNSTPCKMRAKRGFATHPRSIAERVRRTRISNRMKKLQELFPTIDKQTSNADMLDLAVKYIKDLQKDMQTLKDVRARCTCSSKQLQTDSTE